MRFSLSHQFVVCSFTSDCFLTSSEHLFENDGAPLNQTQHCSSTANRHSLLLLLLFLEVCMFRRIMVYLGVIIHLHLSKRHKRANKGSAFISMPICHYKTPSVNAGPIVALPGWLCFVWSKPGHALAPWQLSMTPAIGRTDFYSPRLQKHFKPFLLLLHRLPSLLKLVGSRVCNQWNHHKQHS